MAATAARKRLSAPVRREQIVATALDLFARRGFEGTTTRAVADAAGISEALLFRFFPAKESLYDAIIHRKIDERRSDIFPEEAARRGDDRAVFTYLAGGLFGRMQSDPPFTRLLLFSGLERHSLAASFYRMRIQIHLGYLETYIRRRIAEKAFRRVDPAAAARVFFGSICNYALMMELFRVERRSRIKDTFVETVVNMTLHGLTAAAGRRSR